MGTTTRLTYRHRHTLAHPNDRRLPVLPPHSTRLPTPATFDPPPTPTLTVPPKHCHRYQRASLRHVAPRHRPPATSRRTWQAHCPPNLAGSHRRQSSRPRTWQHSPPDTSRRSWRAHCPPIIAPSSTPPPAVTSPPNTTRTAPRKKLRTILDNPPRVPYHT